MSSSKVPPFDQDAIAAQITEMLSAIGADRNVIYKDIKVHGNINSDQGTIDFDVILQIPDEPTQVRFTGKLHVNVMRGKDV